jgi:glycosyltransferase involved in cell wall biosynthesis
MRATIAASMQRTPLPVPLAVIVPAYNRSSSLNRALASVGVQTLTPAEVVVVDDASSDDTADVARSLGARVVVHEVNQGEGAARNTALAATEQSWVALLDSDDEWLPTHLEDVWAARDGHVLVSDAAVSVGTERPRVYGWPGRRPRVLRSPAAVAFPANVVQPSAALVAREPLLAAGGFPVGMRQAGDLHTWLRLLEHGTGVLLPTIGVRYHFHEGQVSTDREAMFAAELGLVDEFAGRPWQDRRLRPWIEATRAWDTDRRAALRLAARSPAHAEGLARQLAFRWRVRRASRRL